MSRRDPVPLSEALAAWTRGLGLPDPEALGALLRAWNDIVGPDVAPHARPVSLRAGVLTVAVEDPAWASHLRYAEDQVVRRAGECVRPGLVAAVRVVVRRGEPGGGAAVW